MDTINNFVIIRIRFNGTKKNRTKIKILIEITRYYTITLRIQTQCFSRSTKIEREKNLVGCNNWMARD